MKNHFQSDNTGEIQLQLPEMPHTIHRYEILKGHERTDGSWKTDDQLKTEYVQLTDSLINRMLGGLVTYDTEVEKAKPFDFVVWLDKSARPLAWLTKELWPILASDRDGNLPKMPEFKFVNIDRNQWTTEVDPENIGSTDVSNISPTIIRSLRSIFLKNPNDKKNGLIEEIDEAPTIFDGKSILIVDEVRSSGKTLNYAESFFRRAFPDSVVDGAYWMSRMHRTKEGSEGNADIPVWYSDKTSAGRGIGNRNIDLSLKSKNRTQRLGARFLSTALQEDDPLSVRLRLEFKQLANDVRSHKVLVNPSIDRDIEDYDERALRLNGFTEFDTFKNALFKLREQVRTK